MIRLTPAKSALYRAAERWRSRSRPPKQQPLSKRSRARSSASPSTMPRTAFAVLKVQTRGKRDLVTVVGHAASVIGAASGSRPAALGQRPHSWPSVQGDRRSRRRRRPGLEGIEKYLASGQMRGIGPAMAKRIVAAFGEATFEIIEAESGPAEGGLRHRPCDAPQGSWQAGPSRRRCGRS